MRQRMIAWLFAGLLLAFTLLAHAATDSAQPKTGEIPPDALGRDRLGAPVTISQHKGKVVIVTFWASWCGPCRAELPILGKVQKVVGRDHLEVIAVNFRESRKDFNAVLRANPDVALTYVPDVRGVVSDRYRVHALPNMFIIDREGKIAHVHLGYGPDMLDGFVQEMLALLSPDALAKPAEG